MPEKHPTILLVDDDLQLLQLVALNLELEGYTVLLAGDGKQALSQIERASPDLVVLDVMMPRMDGFTVCHRVREFSTVPIIMVTAKERSQDKVRGLDLGADDYLTKPLNMEELLARVRAVLRRAQFREDERALSTTLTLGQLAIDFGQRQVVRSNQKVTLTPTEYRLLAFLARHAGRIVLQDTLLEQIWGKEYVDERDHSCYTCSAGSIVASPVRASVFPFLVPSSHVRLCWTSIRPNACTLRETDPCSRESGSVVPCESVVRRSLFSF